MDVGRANEGGSGARLRGGSGTWVDTGFCQNVAVTAVDVIPEGE